MWMAVLENDGVNCFSHRLMVIVLPDADYCQRVLWFGECAVVRMVVFYGTTGFL